MWNIIGHTKIKEALQQAVENDVIFQSYLFVGRSELGKKLVAQRFIQHALCKSKKQPCLECAECRKVEKWQSENAVLLSGKTISIKDIRKLKERNAIQTNSKLFFVIDGYKNLSPQATHAMLKTLEEPQENVHIIILAKNKHEVLPTIISRSFIVNFLPVTEKEMRESYLSLTKEQAALADGRPGRAKRILEKGENEHINTVQKILKQETVDRFKTIEKFTKEKKDTEELLETIVGLYRKALYDKINGEQSSGVVADIVRRYSAGTISKIITNTEAARSNLKKRVNTRLILENLCINL